MLKHFKNTNGFTLIEVLASIVLFSILTTGSLYIFQTAFFQTNQTQVKTSALNVARNTLMFMENQNFIEMRETFKDLSDDQPLTIKLCDNKYTITEKHNTITTNENSTTCQKISIDNMEFDVKVYANEEVKESKDFYSFYIPIRIEVSWDLKGKHFVELKGDIKSEDLR